MKCRRRPNPVRGQLTAAAFPGASPLNTFFAWNEARRSKDRRYRIIQDVNRILQDLGGEICLAHLAGGSLGMHRSGERITAASATQALARRFLAMPDGAPAVAAARGVLDSLQAAIGSAEMGRHARVFSAFEVLARHVDLDALALLRAQPVPAEPKRVDGGFCSLLGALGDFIQALGPVPAIRRYHANDHIALLTTARYSSLAAQSSCSTTSWSILVQADLTFQAGWPCVGCCAASASTGYTISRLPTAPTPISGCCDRIRRSEWSGTAWRCSHPHANLSRDRQHTMDRQAEQLLMAGIYPVPVTPWLPVSAPLPATLAGQRFALLIPGSSPKHLAKRWPAANYGELSTRLLRVGYLPVVVGAAGEEALGRTILGDLPRGCRSDRQDRPAQARWVGPRRRVDDR